MSALNSLSQHQPPTRQTASASQPHSSARSAPPSDGGAVVGTSVPALEANGSRIYVGNPDYWTQAYEVLDVFRIYGPIKAHHMSFASFRPGQIERSKGYMFIEYKQAASAAKAIRQMNTVPFKGRSLKVERQSCVSVKEGGHFGATPQRVRMQEEREAIMHTAAATAAATATQTVVAAMPR